MTEIRSDVLTLWNDIYLISGIPFLVSDMDGNTLCSFPNKLQSTIVPELYEFVAMEIRKNRLKEDLILYFITETYCCIFCPLTESVFMVSMPISIDKHGPLPFNFIHNFVKPEAISYFVNLLRFSYIRSIHQTSRLANLVKTAYCHMPVRKTLIHGIGKRTSQNVMPDSDFSRLRFSEEADVTAALNTSLFYEQDIIDAITRGDVFSFIQAMHRPSDLTFGKMSSNALQQQKYLFVINLYVYSHAAVRGGMDPELALSLSDFYCLKLDSLKSIPDIIALTENAGKEYCEKVAEAKGSSEHSAVVSACCKYIYQHLFESIRLQDLEDAVHMNRRSLTIHFKAEIGETIPAYILRKKLEEARSLLKCSDFSISEISVLLSFSSQSHFTRQFREYFHLTPKQYRERM